MKVFYLSEALRRKHPPKIKKPDYMKTIELLRELAIENIKEGEKPWWFTEEKKLKYNYLLKDKKISLG